MTKLLERAGASFLRAFAASLVLLLPGVLSAPNLDKAYALGTAAFIASIAAGFRALQELKPTWSFKSVFGDVVGAYVDSFVRAALGTFLTLITGALQAPDLNTGRSLATAALAGALAAGFRALQGFGTKGEYPAPQVGG